MFNVHDEEVTSAAVGIDGMSLSVHVHALMVIHRQIGRLAKAQ